MLLSPTTERHDRITSKTTDSVAPETQIREKATQSMFKTQNGEKQNRVCPKRKNGQKGHAKNAKTGKTKQGMPEKAKKQWKGTAYG